LPTFLAPLVILSAAAFAILVILYRIYETRVEQPKKLEDELKEALAGAKPEVESVEPVRKAAVAVSYAANKIVIIRDFGKKPPRIYTVDKLIGIEVFVDDKVVARVMRAGPHKMLDDMAPQVHKVAIRLIFDDPSHPDYVLVLWDPQTDNFTALAEGPRAAMVTASRWFYHVEAILRSTIRPPRPVTGAPPAAAPVPVAIVAEPPPVPTSPPPVPEPAKIAAAPASALAPPPKAEGDVLNAPLIPYI